MASCRNDQQGEKRSKRCRVDMQESPDLRVAMSRIHPQTLLWVRHSMDMLAVRVGDGGGVGGGGGRNTPSNNQTRLASRKVGSVEELEALPEGTVSDEGNHTIDSMQVHRGLVSTRDDPVSLRGD